MLPEIGGVALRLMLDGTVDGYESYEGAVAGQPTVPLHGDRVAMALSVWDP